MTTKPDRSGAEGREAAGAEGREAAGAEGGGAGVELRGRDGTRTDLSGTGRRSTGFVLGIVAGLLTAAVALGVAAGRATRATRTGPATRVLRCTATVRFACSDDYYCVPQKGADYRQGFS